MEASSLATSAMPTQESLFASPIVHVYVGKNAKLFHVHKDILSRSPLLFSRISEGPDGLTITEPRISVLAFDLALQFLYGRPFDDMKDKLSTTIEFSSNDANVLKPACELLCAAVEYELADLEGVLASYFLSTCDVNYPSILAAAKYVYTRTSKIEPWFENFISQRTHEALVAYPGLVDETWFMDLFERGHNGLSRHLFECYKNWCRSPHTEVLTPASERDKSVGFEKHNYPEQLNSPTVPSKELPIAWDYGLNPKERKKREKQMKLDGTWSDRVTQDIVKFAETETGAEAAITDMDPVFEAAPNMSTAPKTDSEVEVFATVEPEPEPEPVTQKVPWDHGLNIKERRKKQKAMQADGSWYDRITQEMIDEENAIIQAAIPAETIIEELAPSSPFIAEPEPEFVLEPEPEPIIVPEPEPEPGLDWAEEKRPWDAGLGPKERKRKERRMKLDGIWETRLTQEMIDAETAAAAATAATEYVEVEPEPYAEAEPVPELDVQPEPIIEEPYDWGFGRLGGLKSKDKKKEERTSTFDCEPEPEPVLREEKVDDEYPDPWGFGFAKKKKDKKQSCFETEHTFEPEVPATIVSEPMPEPESIVEESFDWGFGRRSGSKSKPMSKEGKGETEKEEAFLLSPEPELAPTPERQKEDKINDLWASWGVSSSKKKKKSKKTLFLEVEPEPEPQPEPIIEELEEPLAAEGLAEDSGNHNLCPSRSQHLLRKSRWEACPVCIEEVTSMARSAALA